MAAEQSDAGSTGTDTDATQGDADADDRDDESADSDADSDTDGGPRRRRRRGGRRRRKPSEGNGGGADNGADRSGDSGDRSSDEDDRRPEGESSGRGDTGDGQDDADGESTGSRRRRRRRRSGDDNDGGSDDSDHTGGGRARKPRNPEDEITSIGGSTRLEAKKQRRREGREAGRRRAPIVSEAEFLARRESVDRVMVIRQHDDLTQIGVLEDKVLVEHYVARESQTSLIGNVYLGRVQNVLPSMEAAFIDIGKGRNAVLYAGEVNWSALGHKDGQPRKIESVLSSGQTILVQVTKDPVGHKGARLTGQVSLPGRFLVYVPEGNTSGISRKLPDTERNRLKTLLKEIVPDTAGVIVRTAAEGASEDELTQDVERLTARWGDIEAKVKSGKAPQLLYGEPDLTLKVVRDLFTEDFAKLVVQGDDAWDLVDGYVQHVAPDLRERLERFEPGDDGKDLFATYRVDEQIAKGLDRKVWLPSGGSLIIDRTEAMTVVDVNTGKFTGSGGNLEETVTKNNLEAAEEIVRQLRLRDIGGIIVVDFIDMVLESNRDLVLRRLVECLGRDRTRHQVAEVTSLGLVQMTRKRIGTGLLEAFSHDCEACKGRGVVVEDQPVEPGNRSEDDDSRGRGGRSRGGRSRSGSGSSGGGRGGNGGGRQRQRQRQRWRQRKRCLRPALARRPRALASAGEVRRRRGRGGLERVIPGRPVGRPVGRAAVERADRGAERDRPTDRADPRAAARALGERRRPPAPRCRPSSESSDSTRTGDAPKGADADEAAAPVAPEPPKLVTSTRRRTARRPAGPPVGPTGAQTSDQTGDQTGDPTGAPASLEDADRCRGRPRGSPVRRARRRAGRPGRVRPRARHVQPDPRAAEYLANADRTDRTRPGRRPGRGPDARRDQDGEEPRRDETDENGVVSVVHVPIKRKGSRKR